MIYSGDVKKAMVVAYGAHRGMFDRGGFPYFAHPLHVAEQMTTEDSTVAALLHDVVEDTNHTMADLERLGFKPEVLEALVLLTHFPDVPYLDYVAKLKNNRIAREVKLADLKHNSDISRLPRVTREDLERVGKYKKAIALLEGGCEDV